MRHSASESIHPGLQQALNCLDIRLEEELIRYRKRRTGQAVPPVILPPKAKKVEQTISKPTAIDLPAFGNSLTPPKAISADILASDESRELAPIPSEPEEQPESLFQPAIDQVNGTITESDAPPDDYLESSEELLRNLAREEAKVKVERTFLESLVTPLGVGSMMVLLLSSAMFGYIIMNPSSLQGLGSLFARQDADQSATQATNETPYPPIDSQEFVDLGLNNLTALQSRPGNAIPMPGVPSITASPIPTVSPLAPVVAPETPPVPTIASNAGKPSNNENSNAQSYNSAPARPVQGYNAPAPAPAPAEPVRSYRAPEPASAPARSYRAPEPPIAPASVKRTSSGGYSYKVEIPYTGDQSLESAQKVAPGAYLRPDGKIQLGAVGSQAEAKARAEKLKQQGLEVEVKKR